MSEVTNGEHRTNDPARGAVPYVAPACGCRTLWFAAGTADDVIYVHWADSAANAPDDVLYRITPFVYVFLRRQLAAIEDKAYGPVVLPKGRNGRPVDPDDPTQPDPRAAAEQRAAVRAALTAAAERWAVIENWAAAAFSADEITAADRDRRSLRLPAGPGRLPKPAGALAAA